MSERQKASMKPTPAPHPLTKPPAFFFCFTRGPLGATHCCTDTCCCRSFLEEEEEEVPEPLHEPLLSCRALEYVYLYCYADVRNFGDVVHGTGQHVGSLQPTCCAAKSTQRRFRHFTTLTRGLRPPRGLGVRRGLHPAVKPAQMALFGHPSAS